VKKNTLSDSASICGGGGNPKPSTPLLTPVKRRRDDDSDDEQQGIDSKYSSPYKSPKQIYPARILVTVIYLSNQNDASDRKPVMIVIATDNFLLKGVFERLRSADNRFDSLTTYPDLNCSPPGTVFPQLVLTGDIDRKIPLPIESIDSEFDVLSYKTFCDWALTTLSTEASFIDKCRLTSIDNIATSLRVDKIRKKTVTIWRAQSAKRWEDGMGYSSLRTDGDVGELSPLNDSETDRPPDEIQSIINYLQELAHSNSARPKKLLALTFLEKQSKELCKLFSTKNEATNVAISGILLN
jgi:hypothetical protein